MDFAIVVNPIKHPDLVLIHLCDDEVCFWKKKPESKAQKIGHENLTLICDPALTQSQKLINDSKYKKLNIKRYLYSSNLEVIESLITSGTGIGILPSRVATRRKDNKLVKLKEKLPTFKDKIYLVYRQDLQKTKASRFIIDTIKESIR